MPEVAPRCPRGPRCPRSTNRPMQPRRRTAPEAPGAPDARAADEEPKPRMELAQLKAVIEALMFASPDPITPRMLNRLLNDEPKEDVKAALESLKADYVDRGGLHMAEVAGGFQITTRPEYHEWVQAAVPRALVQQAVGRVARNALGDRLQAAGDRRGDRRDSQRQHLGRAVDAARASPDQDRRPQERHRPAVPLRHDQGIPDSLRAQRSRRPAEDRGHGPATRASSRPRC